MATYIFCFGTIILFIFGIDFALLIDRFFKIKGKKTINKKFLFVKDKKEKEQADKLSLASFIYQIIQYVMVLAIIVVIVLQAIFPQKIYLDIARWTINIYGTIVLIGNAIFVLLLLKD